MAKSIALQKISNTLHQMLIHPYTGIIVAVIRNYFEFSFVVEAMVFEIERIIVV